MNETARQILALFVLARRKYGLGLTPAQLAGQLGIDAGQIRAAERGNVINREVAQALGAWCGIKLVDGGWAA